MPKITAAQFFVMLFLCRVFTFFTLVPGARRAAGGAPALLALPIAALLCLLVMLPAYLILRRREGQGILEYAYGVSPAAGTVCATLFGIAALLAAVDSAARFTLFITSAIYPQESGALFIVLFTLTAMYLVWMGLEATARFSGLVLVALLLSVGLIVASLAPRFDPVGILSPLTDGWRPVAEESLFSLGETVELLFLLVCVPAMKGGIKKGFFAWLLSVAAALAGMVLVTLAASGDYAGTQTYPVYAVAKMARLFYFQRMDALHMVVWTMVGLIKTALSLWVCRQCFATLCGAKAQRFLLPLTGAAAAAGAAVLIHYFRLFQALDVIFLSAVPLVLLAAALPVALRLARGRHRKGEQP